MILKRPEHRSRTNQTPVAAPKRTALGHISRAELMGFPRGYRRPEEVTTTFTLWSPGPLPPEWADLPVRPPPAEAPPQPAPAYHAAWTPPLTLETLPSLEQLEAEVRRRSVGQTIIDICLDLGVSPSLCSGPFWNRLLDAIQHYRGALPKLMWEMRRRERRFEKEDWKYPRLPLPEQTLAGIREVLGFRIGEQPVDPFRPALSPYATTPAATGPP